MQMEAQDLPGICISAMVGVMEQRAESELVFQGEDGIHYAWLVPLVDEHNVRSTQLVFKIGGEPGIIAIKLDGKILEAPAKVIDGFDGALLLLLYEVC